MCCVAAFVCKARTPMQVVFEVKVHFSPVTVYSLFAKDIFNKENPLFTGGSVSRLIFCYHSMNLKSLQVKALLKGRVNLVCRLLLADKISFTISHYRSVKNSLNCLFFLGELIQPVGI